MRFPAPLVSALVTTFNHEAYIGDAIESLLDQTYSALEIIVVDDGSQDSTFDIACRYVDRGVRVLRGPKKGPSHAMNLAMALASGDIFLLQSGDDLSSPSRAETQVSALSNVDIHAGLPTLIDEHGRALPDTDFPVFFRAFPSDMLLLFKSLYENGNFLCASTIAVRRTVWQRIGGFNPGLLQLQDYDYWLRAVSEGFVISMAEERLASYRLHGTNLSNSRHNIRVHRELGAIFRMLGPNIPDAFVKEILYGSSFNGFSWGDEHRGVLNALMFLRHPAETVRQIGFEALIGALSDDNVATSLEREFAVSFRTIFELLLRH